MTLAKVAAGQPLKISAESFNAFVDAATAYQASRQSRSADGGMTSAIPGIILLRNDSGTDQGRFAVLGLDDPLILPSENPQAFQERITFSGVSPDEHEHANRFGILQEPIAAGGVGRAMVAGVTPMRLDIDAEEDELAAIVTDETGSLATGDEGGARILWKEPGTGAAWGIVQFPAGGAAGGSPNLVLTVTVTNHGWLVGDVLRWTGATWALADAGVVGATDVLGVVGRIPDEDTALLVLWGICCLDGLTPHTDYWLDPGVPGGLTPTKPGENGRLVLHHAQDRLCVVRAGSAGAGGGADRFADLTDVDVITTPPADKQAPIWDAAAERWKPHDVILADPVPAHQVLAGPVSGPDAKPDFRDFEVGDLKEIAGTTVLANATGASARPTAFAATTDDRALLRVGGTLQWLQIPTGAFADGAVTTAKLADGAVTAPKLAANAVTTAAVADGAITDAKIVTVAWAKITGPPQTAIRWPDWSEVTGKPFQFPPTPHDHVVGGDLAGTTANAQIVAGAVGTLEIADGSVTDPKLVSLAWAKLTGVPSTFPPSAHDHVLGGDLTGTTANAQIAANAVGNAELAANAVTGPKIADGTIPNAKLVKDYLTIAGVDYHLGDPVTNLLANPMTTAGDLIVGGAAGAPTRLPGNPGGTLQILTAKGGVTQLLPHTLDLMEDVEITAPQDKQILAYDAASSTWKNTAAAAGSGHGQHPALVGKITAKTSGNVYVITLYPEYPSLAVAWVTSVTQLQGDTTKTIPPNTWAIACGVLKTGQAGTSVAHYDFFVQVPVWM